MFNIIILREDLTVVRVEHGDNHEALMTERCGTEEEARCYANGLVDGIKLVHQISAAPLTYKVR